MPVIGAIAVVFALYALVSARLRGTPITGPMVFVSAGLLLGYAGVASVDAIDPATDPAGFLESSETALMLANITLAILLFADARRIDVTRLRRDAPLAARLLGIGLPLTIALGGALAFVTFGELDLWEALLLAAIVAPTDLALGQAVVANERVPARIRDALDLEGGLNDGLVLPFFTVFLVFAAEDEHVADNPLLSALAEKLGYGILVGVAVGVGGGLLLGWATRLEFAAPLFQQLGLVALAVLAWWATEEIHGSGFIGAFVGGAAAAWTTRGVGGTEEAVEGISEGLMLIVFFLFGLSAVTTLDKISTGTVLYAVLALTVVRGVPVAISTAGAGLDRVTVAFLAWFGPRGLATVVFALLALTQEPALPGMETIVVAATLTVLISVYAHGLTAAPLSERYARRRAAPAELAIEPGPDLERLDT
jgi:sodium/hydrogen antiporter